VASSSLTGRTIVAITCGDFFTLALDTTGAVHAWGLNESGQVGDGTTNTATRPVLISGGAVAGSSLTSGVVVVAIAAGNYHALALDSGGAVHAWGDNANGRLGKGTTTNTVFERVPAIVAQI